jgi:hypothetical protein
MDCTGAIGPVHPAQLCGLDHLRAGDDGDGAGARAPGRDPEGRSYGSWTFSDPHGNGWLLQEITQRLPGRE